MGYSLHLTRAADWTESEAHPLTLQEWLAYVDREPSLEHGPGDDVTWTPASGAEPLLLRWQAGRVDCDGADQARAEQRRRRRLALRVWLEQLRFRITHLFRPPRHDPWLRPGARVREQSGERGTVVRVQPWAMHGGGLVTVRYDDGRELTMAMFAHGLERDD